VAQGVARASDSLLELLKCGGGGGVDAERHVLAQQPCKRRCQGGVAGHVAAIEVEQAQGGSQLGRVLGCGEGKHGSDLSVLGLAAVGCHQVTQERHPVGEEEGFARVDLQADGEQRLQHCAYVLQVLAGGLGGDQDIVNKRSGHPSQPRPEECVVDAHLELGRGVDTAKGHAGPAPQPAVSPELRVLAAVRVEGQLVVPLKPRRSRWLMYLAPEEANWSKNSSGGIVRYLLGTWAWLMRWKPVQKRLSSPCLILLGGVDRVGRIRCGVVARLDKPHRHQLTQLLVGELLLERAVPAFRLPDKVVVHKTDVHRPKRPGVAGELLQGERERGAVFGQHGLEPLQLLRGGARVVAQHIPQLLVPAELAAKLGNVHITVWVQFIKCVGQLLGRCAPMQAWGVRAGVVVPAGRRRGGLQVSASNAERPSRRRAAAASRQTAVRR
jgi:hypothetical protein